MCYKIGILKKKVFKKYFPTDFKTIFLHAPLLFQIFTEVIKNILIKGKYLIAFLKWQILVKMKLHNANIAIAYSCHVTALRFTHWSFTFFSIRYGYVKETRY